MTRAERAARERDMQRASQQQERQHKREQRGREDAEPNDGYLGVNSDRGRAILGRWYVESRA